MKISLRQKKRKDGTSGLYIEFYKGSFKNEQGKQVHNRKFEYLDYFVYNEPITREQKQHNKESLTIANNIMTIRKQEVLTGKYGFKDPDIKEIKLLDYFNKLKEDRNSYISNYGIWISLERYIKAYFHPSTLLSEITIDEVEGFKKFIETKATTKYNTPLKDGSKYSYFNRFRTILKSAYENGYITNIKITQVKPFESKNPQREYLTFDELKLLAQTECKYPVLKRAFIFACLTGLRWSDIYKLRWSEIREEGENLKLIYTQQKTQKLQYLYINELARELIGKRKSDDARVFTGLEYGVAITTELLRWCSRAGINKHITFHCSRHTSAVLLLERGVDIYTLMQMLGHRDVRTTQIYTKVISQKLIEASKLIPKFDISI